MGETYPPAAAWGAQGASPLQPELLYICPGHFSSVTESSGHTIYTHLSHMLALWKVNVSQCSDARGDTGTNDPDLSSTHRMLNICRDFLNPHV